MKHFWFAHLLLVALISGRAGAEGSLDHTPFTKILKQVVVYRGGSSQVKYPELKTLRPDLDKYLSSLSAVSLAQYEKFSRFDQMAFLINAYNGFTLQLILDHYPISSIKKITWFASPWKKKFFKLFGEDWHLDRIEHEWLRPKFKDPRVHFAVNCASIGCPRLRDEAYRGEVLEAQLNDQGRAFLRDETRNRLDLKSRTLEISKIFDWFKEDFKPTVQEFVAPFLTDDPALQAQLKNFKVKYTNYDWALNKE